jgi:hypothetical protein
MSVCGDPLTERSVKAISSKEQKRGDRQFDEADDDDDDDKEC